MAWFRVQIRGGNLDAAEGALRGAGITMRELVYAHFVGAGPPRLTVLSAVVETDSAEAAEAEVRSGLPDGDYELEPTELPQSSK